MCEDCSLILYSAASLARHKEMVHRRETEKFICFDCGQLRFMERRHNYRCNRSLVGNIRVRDQRQALICGTCKAFSLWLRQEIKMESQAIGQICTVNF